MLPVPAIVRLAGLLSHATESVAAKTGDTLYALVKASIAGAIVTNTLFMLGMSFLLGGLRYHVQEYLIFAMTLYRPHRAHSVTRIVGANPC